MGIEASYKYKEINLNEEAAAEITTFLNRKKGEVFWALVQKEGMSNKEVAAAVDTTPTSFSNIVMKFDRFQYKLIESKSDGRKRCYYLTKLGWEYVDFINDSNRGAKQNEIIYYREEKNLVEQFMDAVGKLKACHGEKWEVVVNKILNNRIYCSENIGETEDEKLVNEIIFFIETALEKDYDGAVMRCMEVFSTSIILSECIEEYLKVFYAFSPFCKEMQQEETRNAIGRIFRLMIMDEEREWCEMEIQQLGLETYSHDLEIAIKQIKKYCHEQKEELIYEKLKQFMPVRDQLNFFLASWIGYYNKQKD